ncbi:MAG: DUF2158 domain-containing protein [Janthinobacterium lividum]
METKDFKIGDVVFLNSGIPQMTINHLNEARTQANLSYWNTVSNRFEEATFSTEVISLVLYDETL